MNTDAGFMRQPNPAMQGGAMRLASSEHGPVGPWNTPMMATGGNMAMNAAMSGPSPVMQVGYAGNEGGILQMSGGHGALPGAPPMMGGSGTWIDIM